ncbi:hypothetical protein ACFVIB_01365 [Streptomyces nigra]|uniref:hypothetical protein n=1 Tax=Streptomyces nigra TaxID=1827580 RepID=UPI00363649BC
MDELHWCTADVVLYDKLVPDPTSLSNLMSNVQQARVAIQGAFLHIDPQRGKEAYPGQGTWKVTVVAASAVKTIEYTTMEP